MSQDWTEKYRPQTLSDVLGNPKVVSDLKAWAESWDRGIPKFRAVVLMGTPGIGKTTSAEALARDMGWGLLEMNASDQRTGDAIKNIALRGAYSNTFTDDGTFLSVSDGGRKLIILDEADSLFGNADRGALPAIVELIRETKQPVILIVNDFYALSKKSSAIKNETLQLQFIKPASSTMVKVLRKICTSEGVEVTDDALRAIAENSNGDMRAAVRDLESLALGKKELRMEDTSELSDRIVRKSMYDLMSSIFRKADAMGSRILSMSIDEEPSYKMLWLDENMPYEYLDRGDLVRGYEKMSRADIFLGRVSKRQYYGMWSYANDTMTAGVCTARRTSMYGHDRFRFPSYMMKLSRSKGVRAVKSSICQKLADHIHTSTGRVAQDVLPGLKIMVLRDPELRITLINDLELEPEELAFLMNMKVDSKAVKETMAEAAAVKEAERPKKAVPEKRTEPKVPEKRIEEIVPEKKETLQETKPPEEKNEPKPRSKQMTLF